MTREVVLAIFVGFNILIYNSVETRGLCRNPLSSGSPLCKEYLELQKVGSLINCENSTGLSCIKRCNNTDERNETRECYCDAKCSIFGDCCVDYSLWCNTSTQHTATVTCRASTTNDQEGHVVQIGCPASWHDEVTKDLCLGSNSSEPLTRIPVYDYETNVTFNNVYCALCNNVSNIRYWQIKFAFQNSSDLEKAKKMSLARLLNTYKNWTTEPASSELQEFCIPGVKGIPATIVNQNSDTKTTWSLCKAYYMKVTDTDGIEYNNPHCGLLISNAPPIFDCAHANAHGPTPPGITLIFTFMSKGTPALSKNHNQRVQEYSCQPNEVYDPFEDRCRTFLVSSTTVILFYNSDINNISCTRVSYNSSEYVSYPNGSILILSQQKIYTNKSYTSKGDNILLCTNFTTNYTRNVYDSSTSSREGLVASILGLVGSVISTTASLCLLLTRVVFRELRTLYGKSIMNLASSLVIFHIAFFISNDTEFPTVCDAINGVRRYTLLAMFAWMSVMAYDASRRFTAAGLASGDSDHDEEQRRFLKYSLYAWGMPLVSVIVCVIMDVSKVANIGYESGDQSEYCYLSPTNRIYCTAMPIGVVLLFNFVALTRTMIATKRVQQGTRGIPVHYTHPSMTVVCLKLTSVIGLTWVMGLAYAIVKNPYVEYVHIALNSLQGFFVFIGFGCNKQVLSLLKNKFGRRNKVSNQGQNNVKSGDASTQETGF